MTLDLFLKPPLKIFNPLPILAVYLYGSQINGNNKNKESDYDLAVFIENKNQINYRQLLSKIIKDFKHPEKLHLNFVDLIQSSPLYLYQIIKKGRLIYEKNPGLHIQIESLILRLYFDDQYRNAIYYQKLKNKYTT